MADFETLMSEAESSMEALIAASSENDSETLLTPMTQSSSVRSLMVRKLADIVVLPTGQISANERSLTADILLQVIDKVDVDLRMEVALRISRVSECPPALVRALILDEPEIAERILCDCESISSALLIEAATLGTTAHRLLIAQRADLTTAITDALLKFEELEVCAQVLKREKCELSSTSINMLVALSANKVELQPLILRLSLIHI